MLKHYRDSVKHMLCIVLASLHLLAPTTVMAQKSYPADKVVYDVSSPDAKALSHVFDRVSLLQSLYQYDSFSSSIVLVVHEGAISLFAKDESRQDALMQRANDLTLGQIIRFKLCLASAKRQGYKKDDFYSFVEIIPMADAELIELQKSGYAYLR